MNTKERNESILVIIAVILLGIMLLISQCSCNLAIILKSDIHNTHENFKTYRANVKPVDQEEKVDELGDEIEEWFKKWKGGKYDQDS